MRCKILTAFVSHDNSIVTGYCIIYSSKKRLRASVVQLRANRSTCNTLEPRTVSPQCIGLTKPSKKRSAAATTFCLDIYIYICIIDFRIVLWPWTRAKRENTKGRKFDIRLHKVQKTWRQMCKGMSRKLVSFYRILLYCFRHLETFAWFIRYFFIIRKVL